MIVFDGEVLTFKCKECNTTFEKLLGYGPVCPNKPMRKEMLEKNPPVCPKCKSKNVKQTFWSRINHPY